MTAVTAGYLIKKRKTRSSSLLDRFYDGCYIKEL